MAKNDIKDYKVKYQISINYNMTDYQLNVIDNLGDNQGLIDKNTFYDSIKNFSFLDNKRIFEGVEQKEIYEIDGFVSSNTDIPENISFELNECIQKSLDIPIISELNRELTKSILNNDKKRAQQIKNFNNNNKNKNDNIRYNQQSYTNAFGLVKMQRLNNPTQVLQLPNYEREKCEYSNNSYKYTFGVLIYIENDKYVCPICYSESMNPHLILNNFKIIWDSVGVISLKDAT